MRGHLIAALGLFFLFCGASVTAPPTGTGLEAFGYIKEDSKALRARLRDPARHHYSEEQADEFLANAMLRYTQLVRDYAIQATPHQKARTLANAKFLPVHRTRTVEIDRKYGRDAQWSPNWFSLPLLIDHESTDQDLHYFRERTRYGYVERSLDLIRFDRFNPYSHEGFWLPTAIVRPNYPRKGGKLSFTLVHEFPTSPRIFWYKYQSDPGGARVALEEVLERKKGIWLGKVQREDRDIISTLWKSAATSNLIPQRKHFLAKEGENAAGASTSVHQSVSHPELHGDEPIDTSDEEDPRIPHGAPIDVHQDPHALHVVPGPAHEFPLAAQNEAPITVHQRPPLPPQAAHYVPDPYYYPAPRYDQWAGASNADRSAQEAGSSSSVAHGRQEEPQSFLYDFFGQSGYVQPIGPRPLYPGGGRSLQSPQQPQPYQTSPNLHSPDRDSNVNLDLSLAPTYRGAQRDH